MQVIYFNISSAFWSLKRYVVVSKLIFLSNFWTWFKLACQFYHLPNIKQQGLLHLLCSISGHSWMHMVNFIKRSMIKRFPKNCGNRVSIHIRLEKWSPQTDEHDLTKLNQISTYLVYLFNTGKKIGQTWPTLLSGNILNHLPLIS